MAAQRGASRVLFISLLARGGPRLLRVSIHHLHFAHHLWDCFLGFFIPFPAVVTSHIDCLLAELDGFLKVKLRCTVGGLRCLKLSNCLDFFRLQIFELALSFLKGQSVLGCNLCLLFFDLFVQGCEPWVLDLELLAGKFTLADLVSFD